MRLTLYALQDASAASTAAQATGAAAGLPSLPGPFGTVADALSFLRAHPELRTALINFLKADSTKQFLQTVTDLAIKVNPAQAAALVGTIYHIMLLVELPADIASHCATT